MNQGQLREVAAAIQHELELARTGEGYEERAVAEEIVDKLVAPLLADLEAARDNAVMVGDRLGWRLVEAEEHLKWLKWLHAEASFWLALDRDEHESAEALDVFHRRAVYAEQRYAVAKREIARLRREVEFEANGAVPVPNGLSLPVCACLPDGTELPAGWSLPRCSVHPDRGGNDG